MSRPDGEGGGSYLGTKANGDTYKSFFVTPSPGVDKELVVRRVPAHQVDETFHRGFLQKGKLSLLWSAFAKNLPASYL